MAITLIQSISYLLVLIAVILFEILTFVVLCLLKHFSDDWTRLFDLL